MLRKTNIDSNTRLIEFPFFGDGRGQLCALEGLSSYVPFEIKRVYYIWGVKRNQVRGKHAHHQLKQVLVCLGGSCDVLLDDGMNQKRIHLDTPLKGLYIEGLMWREIKNFTPNATLVVLADAPYDESDYVRDYQNFLEEVIHD